MSFFCQLTINNYARESGSESHCQGASILKNILIQCIYYQNCFIVSFAFPDKQSISQHHQKDQDNNTT